MEFLHMKIIYAYLKYLKIVKFFFQINVRFANKVSNFLIINYVYRNVEMVLFKNTNIVMMQILYNLMDAMNAKRAANQNARNATHFNVFNVQKDGL